MTKIVIYFTLIIFLSSCSGSSISNKPQLGSKSNISKLKKSPHLIWGKAVQKKILKSWHLLPKFKKSKVKVKLVILNNGQISELNRLTCIGEVAMCTSVKDAIRRANPLPIPPNNLSEDNRTINLTFN